MKLKFFLNKEGKKIYTLKEIVDGKKTSDAHYKFVKMKDSHNSISDLSANSSSK
jgi:rRNA maturation protein Nop10